MDYGNRLEHFSLRWNNFNDNMKSGFHDLLRREDFVDVTIAAEGKLIQAHKMVLSICSPYFKNIFKTNPCQHPIVFLKDVTQKELSGILQFMYLGEVSVQQEELGRFLKTAEALQIKGLTGEDNSDKNDVDSVKESNKYQPKNKMKLKQIDSPERGITPAKRARANSPTNDVNQKNSYVAHVHPELNTNHQELNPEVFTKTEPTEVDISDTESDRYSLRDSNIDKSELISQAPDNTSDIGDELNNSPDIPNTSALGSDMISGIPGLTNEPFTMTDGNQGFQYFPILTKNQGLCPICGRILQHKKNLQTHIADQHSGIFRCWPCHICHKVCKTWSALRVHTNRHHTKLGATPLLDLTHQIN